MSIFYHYYLSVKRAPLTVVCSGLCVSVLQSSSVSDPSLSITVPRPFDEEDYYDTAAVSDAPTHPPTPARKLTLKSLRVDVDA